MKLINSGKDNIRDGLNKLQMEFPVLKDGFENPSPNSTAEYFADEVDTQIFDIWNTVEDNIIVELTRAGWTK
jgi:hypothetical protein